MSIVKCQAFQQNRKNKNPEEGMIVQNLVDREGKGVGVKRRIASFNSPSALPLETMYTSERLIVAL